MMNGRLFLTNERSTRVAKNELLRMGISHVVSVGSEFVGRAPLEPDGVAYWHCEVDDDEAHAPVMRDMISPACDFIRRAIAQGGRVLVHSAVGVNRAPTLVIAYLVTEGQSLRDAFELVYSRRRCIWPSVSFFAILVELATMKTGTGGMTLRQYADWSAVPPVAAGSGVAASAALQSAGTVVLPSGDGAEAAALNLLRQHCTEDACVRKQTRTLTSKGSP